MKNPRASFGCCISNDETRIYVAGGYQKLTLHNHQLSITTYLKIRGLYYLIWM